MNGRAVTGWRAVDQEPVASRQAVAAGMERVLAAIEAAAETGVRPVVAACWQDEAYLDVPPGLLRRLATAADVVVACAGRPRLPQGVAHVPTEPDESITAEWSIVALTPTWGVSLVATEVAATLPAGTVEAGRAFRVSCDDDQRIVVAHARRLARTFGARMEPGDSARLHTAVATLADADGERTNLRMTLERVVERADESRRAAAPDPHVHGGGLAALADWLIDAGPRAPSLGMVVVRSDTRGLTSLLRDHATAIGRVGDIIVDVPPDATMIVLPGLTGASLEERADEVCSLVSAALPRCTVTAIAQEVPAEHARHDLVGSLGTALARLRQQDAVLPRARR